LGQQHKGDLQRSENGSDDSSVWGRGWYTKNGWKGQCLHLFKEVDGEKLDYLMWGFVKADSGRDHFSRKVSESCEGKRTWKKLRR
jgi:hypothetical protein